jgi:hypothetical protein
LTGIYLGVVLFYAAVGRIPKQEDVAIFKARVGDLSPVFIRQSRNISCEEKNWEHEASVKAKESEGPG